MTGLEPATSRLEVSRASIAPHGQINIIINTLNRKMKRMAEDSYLFTSESVAEGHPDKVADQISDRILDQLIHTDFDVRAGIETMVTSNLVVLSGETSLKNFNKKIDINIETVKAEF